MPILASLNAKNRSKSPFSIGMLFSIISDLTVLQQLCLPMPRVCTMIRHLKKLQHWRMRMALAGPACTGQPSTPDWPAGSARAREAPAAAETDGVLTDTRQPAGADR